MIDDRDVVEYLQGSYKQKTNLRITRDLDLDMEEP